MVVNLNGKDHNIPECYEQLSTRLYQNIISKWDIDIPEMADRNYFKLLCILTDTNFTQFKASAENEVTIWNAVQWVVHQPFQFKKELPKVIDINGKQIEIPRKIGALSIGQNIILKQLIDGSKVPLENIAAAVAVYLQPEYDGNKFNVASARKLQALIEEMPIEITYPIGFFLLNRASRTGWKPRKDFNQMISSLNLNFVKGLLRWRKSKSYISTTVSTR